MMIQQSILKRKPKADIAKLFSAISERDKQGRAKVVLVPGSEAKRYQVILRRFPNFNLITTECRLEAGALGHVDCPGNSHKDNTATICYHSIAAVEKAIDDAGYKAAWAQSQEAAERLNKIHKGKIYRVSSKQNGAMAWIVVAKK